MTKFYFIRHGQTYFNYLQEMQGWSDTPLTQKGHEDAYELGKKLSQLGDFSDTIYCSDMNRSIQTVSELNRGLIDSGRKHLNVVSMMELREQFYGSFEGHSKKDTYHLINGTDLKNVLAEMSPNEMQDRIAELDTTNLAETSKEFWKRFASGIEKIQVTHTDEKPILIVTHSAILTALVGTYAPELLNPIEPNNLSITTVEISKEQFDPLIISYNRLF